MGSNRTARPGWGSETTPDFLEAYGEGELPPVSRLNEGFTQPKSPQHLSLAYHMASLVVEWIEETHGFPAIVRMLREYGEGRSTADVFRSVLRTQPEQMDEQFDRWLREKYPEARVESYTRALTQASEQARGGKQVTQAIESISTMVNQINVAQRERAAEADQLSATAARAKQLTREFERQMRALSNAAERLHSIAAGS